MDDGYTGTNFNRPGFQQLIDDIEIGLVSAVMVKDLSRLGRDYVSVGSYTDSYFPEHNIRFIAVNDAIDSDEGESEIAPFKNILNEMYARDISKKDSFIPQAQRQYGRAVITTALRIYEISGKQKEMDNDPEAATVVKSIFKMCLDGKAMKPLQENCRKTSTYSYGLLAVKGLNRGGKKNTNQSVQMV